MKNTAALFVLITLSTILYSHAQLVITTESTGKQTTVVNNSSSGGNGNGEPESYGKKRISIKKYPDEDNGNWEPDSYEKKKSFIKEYPDEENGYGEPECLQITCGQLFIPLPPVPKVMNSLPSKSTMRLVQESFNSLVVFSFLTLLF
uniref:Putative secreted protein n=1 Tax=Hemileia vastatrix TaxID=203904 RepID=T1UMQ0_9BASI|nr:putative secreted protein [Hemileia vastatrix]